jgi:serine/threonine-protein kinase
MKLCLRCNQYFEDSIELCPIDTSLLESVGEHPLIGALINDRYVVDSVIGKGSSGIVYKATRLLMGREVAVKVLHSYLGAEPGALDRFLREARAASRLRHPHIINIWESGVTDDAQPYFVMDYLEGMTLADLVKQKGYLHAGRAMPIITQICEALTEAHRQNIIHRDIKPENIVLETNEGDNNFDDYVKVLDFGIADQPAGTPGAPKQKTAAGSPAYMSPEQCQGFELDQRSDIYSTAIVIFEMLTGLRPFAADDVMKLFYMHVSQPPPTLSSMRSDLRFPMQVELAVAKALAKNPDNRQQSIKEFHKDLEDAFNSSDMGAPGKRESVPVDLFSVPVVDRLMDSGAAVATGGHNFLPGPEDWDEPGSSEGEVVQPAATHQPVQAKSDAPDVSAAVNRLLKSAKRASEAAKKEDVGSWARDVLTRTDGNTEAQPTAAEVKPVKATGNQSNSEMSGPEVSNWAHKVLNRPTTGELPLPAKTAQTPSASTPPTPATAPTPPAPPPVPAPFVSTPPIAKTPAAVPSSSSTSSPPPPPPPVPQSTSVGRNNFAGAMSSESQTTPTRQGGKVVKPIELLKAKSATDAARRITGENAKQNEEQPAANTTFKPSGEIAQPATSATQARAADLNAAPKVKNDVVESASRLFNKKGDSGNVAEPTAPVAPPAVPKSAQSEFSADAPKNNFLSPQNEFASQVEKMIHDALPPDQPPPARENKFETASSERSPLDPSRFDHPVNRQEETLNPFAQAIDGLLDAAIMPKTTEDVRRSASRLKKMESPAAEGSIPDPMDPDRFEHPINRASFDPSRYDAPVKKDVAAEQTASQNNARYEEPINKGFISGTTAGSRMLGASDAEKKSAEPPAQTSIDLNRFEQPIHKSEESLNPFAQAVDGLLDSARIKHEPRSLPTSSELGETAAAVGKPPDNAAIEALDSTAEEDRVHDAVSRLIEAAKRAPEPTAKPEVLNKKIEAVKKKIEALKAADVAKPLTSGLPPAATPPPTGTPTPFVPGPNDSNSLSDAVNRLLEAAQRQESTTTTAPVAPQIANPFADTYSSPAPPSTLATNSQSNAPTPPASNPFDAGASTAMVNPFAAAQPQEQMTSGTFKSSSRAPAGPAPPDPTKKPPEGSAFQNYVGAQSDRMSRAAELINNAIKSSKTPEVAQDYYSGFKNDPKQIQAERADNLKQSRARVRKNFQGPPRPPLWVAVIFAIIIGGFAAWYGGWLPIGPPKLAPLSVDGYIKQGKFDKARELLETKRKTSTLTQAEVDKLNSVYYQQGLKEGKDENYQDAVKDLKQISRKSDLYPAAAAKIREYKKKMSDL